MTRMCPSLQAQQPTSEGTSSSADSARERIWAALLAEEVKIFEKVSPEGLIGWLYSFSDFVTSLPAHLFVFFSLYSLLTSFPPFQLGCLVARIEFQLFDLSN